MDFVINLPISTNRKSESYDFILVIIDHLTKIIYYKQVKITIDIPGLAKVIIDVIAHHYGIFESIVMDQGLLFISKF